MNFQAIVSDQIKTKEQELNRYFHSCWKDLAKHFKDVENKNLISAIESTFLFEVKYNKNTYENLKEKLTFSFLEENNVISYYKKNPKETLLAIYFHYNKNNINQSQLFQFFSSIIKHVSPKSVLKDSIFIADYDLHSFLLSKIESENFSKLNNYFNQLFIKKITPILFSSYFKRKMFESCELIIKKYPLILNSKHIKESTKLITPKDSVFNKYRGLSILSYSQLNKDFDFTSIISEHLNFYFDHPFLLKERRPLNSYLNLDICHKYLKNDLYTIYNNIFIYKIKNNILLNKEDINLLIKIYCVIHTTLSESEKEFILNYLQKSNLVINILNKPKYVNSIFLFLVMDSEYFDITIFLKKYNSLALFIIHNNYYYLIQSQYLNLKQYNDLDRNLKNFKLLKPSIYDSNSTKKINEFYQQLYNLDIETFVEFQSNFPDID